MCVARTAMCCDELCVRSALAFHPIRFTAARHCARAVQSAELECPLRRYVAHSFAWLRGEEYWIMGGQGWPWMTENQVQLTFCHARCVLSTHICWWRHSCPCGGDELEAVQFSHLRVSTAAVFALQIRLARATDTRTGTVGTSRSGDRRGRMTGWMGTSGQRMATQ